MIKVSKTLGIVALVLVMLQDNAHATFSRKAFKRYDMKMNQSNQSDHSNAKSLDKKSKSEAEAKAKAQAPQAEAPPSERTSLLANASNPSYSSMTSSHSGLIPSFLKNPFGKNSKKVNQTGELSEVELSAYSTKQSSHKSQVSSSYSYSYQMVGNPISTSDAR